MLPVIAPELPDFSYEAGYVTYRRLWLDTCLNYFSNEVKGIVIDLGGKRINKRGSFLPPEQHAQAWWYINLDLATTPDIFADVSRTPLQAATVDCILCTEVLEHLPDPQACAHEIHRLLRDGGILFASAPFFYPVHADPYDFQRFTEDGLRYLFRKFKSVEVYRMGGYPGVLGLLIELGIPNIDGGKFSGKLLRWVMKWVSRWLVMIDLAAFKTGSPSWQKFTTGYFIKVVR